MVTFPTRAYVGPIFFPVASYRFICTASAGSRLQKVVRRCNDCSLPVLSDKFEIGPSSQKIILSPSNDLTSPWAQGNGACASQLEPAIILLLAQRDWKFMAFVDISALILYGIHHGWCPCHICFLGQKHARVHVAYLVMIATMSSKLGLSILRFLETMQKWSWGCLNCRMSPHLLLVELGASSVCCAVGRWEACGGRWWSACGGWGGWSWLFSAFGGLGCRWGSNSIRCFVVAVLVHEGGNGKVCSFGLLQLVGCDCLWDCVGGDSLWNPIAGQQWVGGGAWDCHIFQEFFHVVDEEA